MTATTPRRPTWRQNRAESISAVVDELGLDSFVLMGLRDSMGGRNSFTYAFCGYPPNNPGKVRALVIVDAAPQNMTVQGTDNIRINFVQQDDELESPLMPSSSASAGKILSINVQPGRRDPQQVRGSILHKASKELPNGNWTWKYDGELALRSLPQDVGAWAAILTIRKAFS